jgi:hypothetical protein
LSLPRDVTKASRLPQIRAKSLIRKSMQGVRGRAFRRFGDGESSTWRVWLQFLHGVIHSLPGSGGNSLQIMDLRAIPDVTSRSGASPGGTR